MVSKVKDTSLEMLTRVDLGTRKIYNVRLNFQLETDCLQKFDKEVCGAPRLLLSLRARNRSNFH